MASAFAHELSQPLGAAMNYLNAVRRWLEESTEPRAPRMREGAQRAAAEIARAGQIIQRLRQFIQKGRTDRSWEKVGTVIEEAAALALVGAADRDIKIHIEIAPNLPAAMMDKVQIQQVLTNLIRNAVEAMANMPKRDLTITGKPVKAEAIEIAVADTGPGIAPEVAKDLFRPFVTTKPSGMGVGLSICRSIVQSHGGELKVEPNPAGGSVFRFTLPVQPAEAAPNV
jgi:two-component system sensor kinase FixL